MNPNYKKKVVEPTPNPIFSNTKANEEHNKKYNFIQSDFDAEQNIKNGGLAYWQQNKEKLQQYDHKYEQTKNIAQNFLSGFKQPITSDNINKTTTFLQQSFDNNNAAQFASDADLIYVDASVSPFTFAQLFPSVVSAKGFSAGISFVYSKTLNEAFPVVTASAGLSTPANATISFVHLSDTTKELIKKRDQEQDSAEKKRLNDEIIDDIKHLIKNSDFDYSLAIGVGAKNVHYTRKNSDQKEVLHGVTIGFGANIATGRTHGEGMVEKANQQFLDHNKGEDILDWHHKK